MTRLADWVEKAPPSNWFGLPKKADALASGEEALGGMRTALGVAAFV